MDDQNKSYYEQLIVALHQKGYTDTQMGQFLAQLSATLSSRIYAEIMLKLTDAEKQQVENEEDDKQAEKMMYDFYKNHSNGKSAQEVMDQMRDDFAKRYLEQLQTF